MYVMLPVVSVFLVSVLGWRCMH